ncbi:hypothetical protein GF339_23315 [candidate division KSB3 bacterium]|uniref:NlpC/P60 domain-containing protein n=1 Tax=candidate division KSB3 bacterium TaxID=2044937 RepID=A0A9D5K039_9BACT|nr:hypothetical protein [candidate division KSB3 bacterium]MBD3327534.1 hypothetical protein [candidate division KSB3 bacterium]
MGLRSIPLQTRRIGLLIICVLFLMGGCASERSSSPHSSSRKTSPETHTPLTAFRFGAIQTTYASVYADSSANSERLSECIYGDIVRIEDETRWWYAVKIGPYPDELAGWVHKSAIVELSPKASYLRERNIMTIVIRQNISQVFVWPSQTINIVMGTELPFIGESDQWYLVRLPNNDIGRIARAAVDPQPAISVPTQPLIHSKQDTQISPQQIVTQRRNIINTAKQFLGKVYVWGGSTPRGFDCSGLSYFVYKLNGIELPRVSWLQFRDDIGTKIKKTHLSHGDLVFFQTYKPGPSHVGIYIGDNQFIHASPRYGVTTSNLDEPYFKRRYVGAKTLFAALSQS